MLNIKLTAADANRRLDKYLFQYLNGAPHSLVYRFLRTKKIKLNGKRAAGNEMLAEGDAVSFYLSPEQLGSCMAAREVKPAKHMPEIVFESGSLLIINKPAGMAAHGGMGDDHLLARTLYYLSQTGGMDVSAAASFTPALCNRLDVNTSGIVTCGKTLAEVQRLNRLFAAREAVREYLAVVHGELTGQDTLTGFYRKDEKNNKACVLEAGETEIITEYEAVCSNGGRTLIKARPVTGRSHQIRAHLASIGHPLCGDKKYGGKPTPYAPAQLLHCGKLILEGVTYEAPPPDGFKRCLKDWNINAFTTAWQEEHL